VLNTGCSNRADEIGAPSQTLTRSDDGFGR
jgi:hypothetical protein